MDLEQPMVSFSHYCQRAKGLPAKLAMITIMEFKTHKNLDPLNAQEYMYIMDEDG
jgi:hypothetical protein